MDTFARMVLSVSIVLLALTGLVHAQALRITNEAGGVACYSSEDLLTAQFAIGFHNLDQVRALIARRRCFIMRKNRWQPKITDEHVISGVDVKMVKVRLTSPGETRRVWSLLKNFDFIGD